MDRSELMSRIRSKWTKPEMRVHNFLKGNRIRHEMHPDLLGHPDVLLPDTNTVLFIHGCFWHGCKRHYKQPKTNARFWADKIKCNIIRHKKNTRILLRMGYMVRVIWEHSLG